MGISGLLSASVFYEPFITNRTYPIYIGLAWSLTIAFVFFTIAVLAIFYTITYDALSEQNNKVSKFFLRDLEILKFLYIHKKK